MAILSFYALSLAFGAEDIFSRIGGSLPQGGKVGLVGPNGVGKTTLLRVLAGQMKATAGDIHIARGTQLGYLQQEAVHAFADQEHTVYEEMKTVFAPLMAQAAQLQVMEATMATDFSDELMAQYGVAQEEFERAGGYDYEVRIRQVLQGLGFGADDLSMPLRHCSGGQKTRALLARLLLEKPNLLILDEPTNHLDVAAVEWLEGALRIWEGAVLVVSHDRYFLDRVVDTIWDMSRQGMESYRGNYTAYVRQRQERWRQRESEFNTIKDNFLKELDFIKRNIVRDSSTDRAKGKLRILVRQVKAVEMGGVQALQQNWSRFMDKMEISGTKWNVATVEQHIKSLPRPTPGYAQLQVRLESGPRSGNIVLRAHDMVIGYPDVPLFEIEELELDRLACAALIGGNGTGKTTFLRTLLKQMPPLQGEFQVGASLTMAYFSQAHDTLDHALTVLETILARQHMMTSEARSYLARFLFRGDDVYKPVHLLSGGERGRLALALLAMNKANFLLLDEPTNHLDIPAQEVLQTALAEFKGTILLVSHDRYLVDKLATQIWDLGESGSDTGQMVVHNADYQSYLAARAAADGVDEAGISKAGQQYKAARRQDAAVAAVIRRRTRELAKVEAQIEGKEQEIVDLATALEIASTQQQWDELRDLTRAYQQAELDLEQLMESWGSLSESEQSVD